MPRFWPLMLSLALAGSLGLLQGCGAGTPKAPTPEVTLKADAKTQDAMRSYYGNMIGKKANSGARRSR